VILKPVVAENQVLFPKSGDSQKHPFGVSFVLENHIHDLGNLSCLVEGAINIEDQDVTREGLSVHLFRADKISVNEASGCSAVQESLDEVEFACVCSSNFYWQEEESSSCVQGTDCKGTYPRVGLSDVSRFPPKSRRLTDRLPIVSLPLS